MSGRDEDVYRQRDEMPRHVAVIMDGNNRWARQRNLKGATGHRRGAEVARDLVFRCADLGIQCLTLFAFSSENWFRPRKEVLGLMALFVSVLQRDEIRQMHARNIRLKFIGNRSSFPVRLQNHMHNVEQLTHNNTGMLVTVAADYGGRWDISQACRQLAEKVRQGVLSPEQINDSAVQNELSMAGILDPDLCIRTGGECRISNFLLWQFAYTEFHFTDCYWPDYDATQFDRALADFGRRQRRFGRQSGSDSA
jgi:undecaprenyl diphosphate synthase